MNQSVRRIIPNSFTFGNLLCGFASVIASNQGDYTIAVALIAVAAIADALDGLMARLTHSTSKMGVELDSLADVVSFGFAPAFLIFHSEFQKFGIWGLLVSAAFLFGGAFRLARFNSELVGFSKDYFKGLPIPTGALALASFVYLRQTDEFVRSLPELFTIGLTLLLALLMVSRIKYDTLPVFTKEGIKLKPYLFSFLALSAVIAIITVGRAVFYIFLIFILFGIFRALFSLLRKAEGHSVT